MAVEARDSTDDWALSEAARPRSFAELESRIELAVETARSSEAAVAEVGAAAIEAAEQARQAAELAERAAAVAQLVADRAESAPPPPAQPQAQLQPQVQSPPPHLQPETPAAPVPAAAQEEWLVSFTHRAERLSERLVRLQHV
jgi:hypothetical protein